MGKIFVGIFPLLLAVVVLVGAAVTSTDNPRAYLDIHAFVIVFGGTICAAAISFRFDRLIAMFKVFLKRVIRGRKFEYVPLIKQLMDLADAYRTNSPQLRSMIDNTGDPFIREAMNALLEGILEGDDLIRVLSTRSHTIYERYFEEASKFKAMGKFPPAFGLTGAVLGMIALMQNLGTEGAEGNIGSAMAIALVGTLYGVAFANFFVLPIAENLVESAREVKVKNRIIVEAIKVIRLKKHPIVLAEELNSFLLASERIDWKQIGKYGDVDQEAA